MTARTSITFWGPLVCLALLLVHWVNQLVGTYGLMFDESQYWFWGKTAALGYYSKPPMIGWLIAVSTHLFGNDVFGTKMLSPLLHLGTGFILFQTTLFLGKSRETAWWVFVSYLTMPFVLASGAFFATDTPLMFFWVASFYALLRALKNQSPQWWLLTGVLAGFGLQSKYTMGVFALSALLTILSTKEYRKSLATIWPWLAGIAAAIVFAPNIWWNSQHHFATVSHTESNLFSKNIEIYPVDMLLFIGSQFVVFGPVLMTALITSIFALKNGEGINVLKLFTWPLVIIGIIVSLLAGAQAQWIAPAYTIAVLLIVPWLKDKAPKVLYASLILHLLLLMLFYSAPAVLNRIYPDDNVMTRLFVWNELTPHVTPWQNKYPNAVIITDERKIATALTYGLRDQQGNPHLVYKWNPSEKVTDHYDLLTADHNFTGKDLLLITRNKAPDRLKQSAPQAKLLEEFDLSKKFHFYIYSIRTFNGYRLGE